MKVKSCILAVAVCILAGARSFGFTDAKETAIYQIRRYLCDNISRIEDEMLGVPEHEDDDDVLTKNLERFGCSVYGQFGCDTDDTCEIFECDDTYECERIRFVCIRFSYMNFSFDCEFSIDLDYSLILKIDLLDLADNERRRTLYERT